MTVHMKRIALILIVFSICCIGPLKDIRARGVKFVVTGKVIDAQTCKPIPGIDITLHQLNNNISYQVTTDKNGKFLRLISLPGDTEIIIYHPQYSNYREIRYTKIGVNDLGNIPLVPIDHPITEVCELIKDTAFGQKMKKIIESESEKSISDQSIPVPEQDIHDIYLKELKEMDNNDRRTDHYEVTSDDFYTGLELIENKQYDEAIVHLKKAAKDEPVYIVYKILSQVYAEYYNDNKTAASYMQKAAEFKEKEKEANKKEIEQAYYEAGIYWLFANMQENFYKAFSKVIILNDKNGNAWYYLGMYYFTKSKYNETATAMKKALANNLDEENIESAKVILKQSQQIIKNTTGGAN